MTTELLDPAQVAQYLSEHPDFFAAFPDVLAGLTMPAVHGGRAISLHERQLEVLRERNRQQEARLVELIRIGQENDAIAERVQRWTRNLLLESDAARLPDVVCDGLVSIFSVPQVALRLWSIDDAYADRAFAQPVEPDIVTLTDGMKLPYCGPNADFLAAAWLAGAGADTRSLALIPLRRVAMATEAPETPAGSAVASGAAAAMMPEKAFGLLVLGSPDPDRFAAGMGTAFLERIGEIVSAALTRLAR